MDVAASQSQTCPVLSALARADPKKSDPSQTYSQKIYLNRIQLVVLIISITFGGWPSERISTFDAINDRTYPPGYFVSLNKRSI